MSIIETLTEYSEERSLVDPPFVKKRVHVMDVRKNGKFVISGPIETSIPRLVGRTSNIIPNLASESADIALKVKAGDDGLAKFSAFWGSNVTLLDQLGLSGEAATIRAFAKKFVPNDKVRKAVKGKDGCTWIVPAVDGKPLADHPAVREWFSKTYAAIISDVPPDKGGGSPVEVWTDFLKPVRPGKATCRCLVTGRHCRPVRVHPKVKNMAGCGRDTPFASWDKDTYRYVADGVMREAGDNFPMCRRAAYGYSDALSDILSFAGRGDRTKLAFNTSANSVTAVWPSDPAMDEACSAVVDVMAQYTKKEDVMAAWAKIESYTGDGTVYILSLHGSSGRIAVTSWDELPWAEARSNLLSFRKSCLSDRTPGVGRITHLVGVLRMSDGKQVLDFPAPVYRDLVRASVAGSRSLGRVRGHVTRSVLRGGVDNPRQGQTSTFEERVRILEGIQSINERVQS